MTEYDRDEEASKFMKMGMDTGVAWMRSGNLRLEAHRLEAGEYPYHQPIRPWEATKLIWRSWFNETTGRYRA